MEDKPYAPETYKRHTLFAGTEIVQARYYTQGLVLAVVIRTGFLTTKGGLVRSILFPKPLNIKFYWDSIKFILLLSILAGCGFVYTILVLQLHKPPVCLNISLWHHYDIMSIPLLVWSWGDNFTSIWYYNNNCTSIFTSCYHSGDCLCTQ